MFKRLIQKTYPVDHYWTPKATRLRVVALLLIGGGVIASLVGWMVSGAAFIDNALPELAGLLLGIGITLVLIDPVVSAQREEHSRRLLSTARDALGRRAEWILDSCLAAYAVQFDDDLTEFRIGGSDRVFLRSRHLLEWFEEDPTPPQQRGLQAMTVWRDCKEYFLFIRDWFCPQVLDRTDSPELAEAVGELLCAIDELESNSAGEDLALAYLALREFLRKMQRMVVELTDAFG